MSMVKNITSGLIVRKKMLRLKNCEKENMSFQMIYLKTMARTEKYFFRVNGSQGWLFIHCNINMNFVTVYSRYIYYFYWSFVIKFHKFCCEFWYFPMFAWYCLEQRVHDYFIYRLLIVPLNWRVIYVFCAIYVIHWFYTVMFLFDLTAK